MKRLASTVIAGLFLVARPPAAEPDPNTPSTGHYIEAESVEPVSPWVLSTDKSGYSGTGYYRWTGGDTRSTSKGVLAYRFSVSRDGNYIVTLRGRRDQEGECAGAASDLCNDVFSKVDNGTWCKTMIKGSWGQWIWQSRIAECGDLTMQPMKFPLKAGSHAFYIAGRSKGIKFDALTVHLEGTTRPSEPKATPVAEGAMVTPVRQHGGEVTVYSPRGEVMGTFAGHAHACRAAQAKAAAGAALLRSQDGTVTVISIGAAGPR